MLENMKKTFNDRSELVSYLRNRMHDAGEETASPIRGGSMEANTWRGRINAHAYGATRNYLNGAVTGLSPYIRHGVLSLNDVRNAALDQADAATAEGFIRQLAWRDFWQNLYRAAPELVWQDIEPYKTGYSPDDYRDVLPDDITAGQTGVAVIDSFISTLTETGYLHNHARLYLASYIVHWRRIKWQPGARWFLYHLLDADPASNNFSWQWVASTFSNKPYIFNLDNVRKFGNDALDLSAANNRDLDASYDALNLRLFPNLPQDSR